MKRNENNSIGFLIQALSILTFYRQKLSFPFDRKLSRKKEKMHMFLFNWQLKLIATSPFFISSRSSFILQIQNYAKNFHTPSSAFFSNLSIQVCHYCLLFSEFLRHFRPSSLLFHNFFCHCAGCLFNLREGAV